MDLQSQSTEALKGSTSSDGDNFETKDVPCDEQIDRALYEKKSDEIREACKWRDVQKLRILAESTDGLLSDELRGLACMHM